MYRINKRRLFAILQSINKSLIVFSSTPSRGIKKWRPSVTASQCRARYNQGFLKHKKGPCKSIGAKNIPVRLTSSIVSVVPRQSMAEIKEKASLITGSACYNSLMENVRTSEIITWILCNKCFLIDSNILISTKQKIKVKLWEWNLCGG